MGAKESVSNEEVQIDILDRQIYKIRNKSFLWSKFYAKISQLMGATWEIEANMTYHRFFSNPNLV